MTARERAPGSGDWARAAASWGLDDLKARLMHPPCDLTEREAERAANASDNRFVRIVLAASAWRAELLTRKEDRNHAIS